MIPKTNLLVALLCLIHSPVLSAQMSGTYTLDPNGTGSRNFKAFIEVSFNLVAKGISGPVVFEIADGTWLGEQLLYAPQGMSKTNTITLRPRNPGRVVFTRNDNGGVLATRETTQAVIDGLVVEGIDFRGVSTRVSGLVGLIGSNIVLRNCSFKWASATVRGRFAEVHHCTFDHDRTALTVEGEGGEIHHNEFRSAVQTGYAVTITGGRLGEARGRAYNNIVVGTAGSGMKIFNAVDVQHNTILLHLNGATALSVQGQFVAMPSVRNNIVANLNGGSLLHTSGLPAIYYVDVDHNLFWAPGAAKPFAHESQTYATLASYRTATGLSKNAIEADPRFVDVNTLPTGLKLANDSPALGAAVNTPSYVTDDFEGQSRHTPATLGAYKGARPSTFKTYGQGCAGSQQKVPAIGYGGVLALGSQDFRVNLRNALGGLTVQAFLAVGATRATISLGGGCDLLLQPAVLLRTNVHGNGPGNGTAEFKIPLPSNPSLKGAMIHLQWGVADPAAAGIGVAVSDAATLTL